MLSQLLVRVSNPKLSQHSTSNLTWTSGHSHHASLQMENSSRMVPSKGWVSRPQLIKFAMSRQTQKVLAHTSERSSTSIQAPELTFGAAHGTLRHSATRLLVSTWSRGSTCTAILPIKQMVLVGRSTSAHGAIIRYLSWAGPRAPRTSSTISS